MIGMGQSDKEQMSDLLKSVEHWRYQARLWEGAETAAREYVAHLEKVIAKIRTTHPDVVLAAEADAEKGK
jgi:hypothetical protein